MAVNASLSLHRSALTVGIPLRVLANPVGNMAWVPVVAGVNGVSVAVAQSSVARRFTTRASAWRAWAVCAVGLTAVIGLLGIRPATVTTIVGVLVVVVGLQITVEMRSTSEQRARSVRCDG